MMVRTCLCVWENLKGGQVMINRKVVNTMVRQKFSQPRVNLVTEINSEVNRRYNER